MMATSSFELLAAIDLRHGRVVRLRQGDFDQVTTYGDDPVAVARGLVEGGAGWLHVVDLDGARTGRPVHRSVIGAVMASVRGAALVEVAGGLRTIRSIAQAFGDGAARVALGTAAVRDTRFAGRAVAAFDASRICVALDVRAGLALVEAWTNGADGVPVERALESLAGVGVTTFEVTAVDRDGTLGGPDLELLGRLIRLDRGRIIASGGIATLADLRAVRDVGCAGAIVGRALHEGRFDIAAASAMVDPHMVTEGIGLDRPPSR